MHVVTARVRGGSSILAKLLSLLVIYSEKIVATFTSDFIVLWLLTSAAFIVMFSFFNRHNE